MCSPCCSSSKDHQHLSSPNPSRQVGIITRAISVGGDSRYYAVSARRVQRAVEAMVERRSLGEQVRGVRVVLRNDSVNKRERVAAVLAAAGLSEQVTCPCESRPAGVSRRLEGVWAQIWPYAILGLCECIAWRCDSSRSNSVCACHLPRPRASR